MTINDSNFRLAELAKFDSLADDWWNPSGELKTLHVINPVRLGYVMSAVTLKYMRVLDIGCGGGLFTEKLAAIPAQVTGIDASETAIRIARNHLQVSGLQADYQACTVEHFERVGNRPFDVITCMEMLEHVPHPEAIIASAARLLRPGGHLFISTINRNLRSYIQTILVAERLLGLIPTGTHGYADYIRPSEASRWLRAAGLELVDICGMGYLPALDRAWINKDPAVNYIIHAQKPG